jgi:hypothetical protein
VDAGAVLRAGHPMRRNGFQAKKQRMREMWERSCYGRAKPQATARAKVRYMCPGEPEFSSHVVTPGHLEGRSAASGPIRLRTPGTGSRAMEGDYITAVAWCLGD